MFLETIDNSINVDIDKIYNQIFIEEIKSTKQVIKELIEKKSYPPLHEAQKYFKENILPLGITTTTKYKEYVKNNAIHIQLPVNVSLYYGISWGEFSGIDNTSHAKKFDISKEDFIFICKQNNIRTFEDYRQFRRINKSVPSSPILYFEKKGIDFKWEDVFLNKFNTRTRERATNKIIEHTYDFSLFKSDEFCHAWLTEIIYPTGIISPFSGRTDFYVMPGLKYKCKQTRKYFTLLSKTVYSGSKFPVNIICKAIKILCDTPDISLNKFSKTLGIGSTSRALHTKTLKFIFEHNIQKKSI